MIQVLLFVNTNGCDIFPSSFHILLFPWNLILGSDVHLSVLPLQEAIAHLPGPQAQVSVDHDESLELEDIAPENDASEVDISEKKKQMQAEVSSPGWQ